MADLSIAPIVVLIEGVKYFEHWFVSKLFFMVIDTIFDLDQTLRFDHGYDCIVVVSIQLYGIDQSFCLFGGPRDPFVEADVSAASSLYSNIFFIHIFNSPLSSIIKNLWSPYWLQRRFFGDSFNWHVFDDTFRKNVWWILHTTLKVQFFQGFCFFDEITLFDYRYSVLRFTCFLEIVSFSWRYFIFHIDGWNGLNFFRFIFLKPLAQLF